MGSSIQEMYDKFKYILKDDAIFYGMLIVLVAITSFGLGRWSVQAQGSFGHKTGENSVKVLMPASVSTALQTETATTTEAKVEVMPKTSINEETKALKSVVSKQYVGSKNGTKFHLLTCPGAKQIKEENKIFFATKEDAQKAGYTPASNCKGI